jgi:hypothetical protein
VPGRVAEGERGRRRHQLELVHAISLAAAGGRGDEREERHRGVQSG